MPLTCPTFAFSQIALAQPLLCPVQHELIQAAFSLSTHWKKKGLYTFWTIWYKIISHWHRIVSLGINFLDITGLTIQAPHPYMVVGKTYALKIQSFVYPALSWKTSFSYICLYRPVSFGFLVCHPNYPLLCYKDNKNLCTSFRRSPLMLM